MSATDTNSAMHNDAHTHTHKNKFGFKRLPDSDGTVHSKREHRGRQTDRHTKRHTDRHTVTW